MDQQAAAQIRQLEKRSRELERRIEWLTVVVVALAIGLTPIAGLIPLAIVGFLIALPVLSLTHQWLPGIARNFGRLISWFARLFQAGNTAEVR